MDHAGIEQDRNDLIRLRKENVLLRKQVEHLKWTLRAIAACPQGCGSCRASAREDLK